MMKTILGAAALLIVLIAVWLFYKPAISTQTEAISPAFAGYKAAKFDDVAKVTIAKGKTPPVVLRKEGSSWVVASSYSYPADDEKVEKLIKGLREIDRGNEAGSALEAHKEFEVDKKKGGVVTLASRDGKELAKLIVGKNAQGRSIGVTRVFVRFGEDPTTYEVESNIRSDANLWSNDVEAKNYLLKKIVKFPEEMEAQSVRIIRPDKPDVLVERKSRDVPVEKPKDPTDTAPEEEKPDEEKKEAEKPEEKKPETKKEEYFVVTSGTETRDVPKSEDYSARGLLNRMKDFSIEDAIEPREPSAHGLDKPQLKAVVSYRKKDQPESELKTITLLFGNEIKDEKGSSTNYHVAVEGDEYKGRIYTIQKWNFDGWNKEMKDFLPKPKEEPKPAETPAAAQPTPPGSPTPPVSTPPAPPPGPAIPAPGTSPAPPAETKAAAPGDTKAPGPSEPRSAPPAGAKAPPATK